ncbi:MAG: MFS transporter [Actinomycetota bacterium]|nr:MFS transporter [Actinomycetota bacterium]
MESAVRPAGRLSILARAFRKRDIRLVEIAFLAFNTAEWGTWIAILVYAFRIGGSVAAGSVAVIQLVPAAIFAPFGSLLPDLYPRQRMIFFCYLAQSIAMAATATALLLGAPVALIYLLAAVTATAITLTRPAQGALLPMLAASPEELIAANVSAGTIESVSIFVGPALTGLLLVVLSVGAIFTLMAAIELAGALAVWRLAFRDVQASHRRANAAGMWSSLTRGFAVVMGDPDSRVLMFVMAAESIGQGALDVLLVVLAFGVLHMGGSGAGFLNSSYGAGGVLGAGFSVVLIGRTRLAPYLLLGALTFGVALATAGATTTVVVALVLLALSGAGGALFLVAGRSLLQRIVPTDSMSRAFGALEGLVTAGLAVGAILAPVLVKSFGVRPSLVVVGGLVPVVSLAGLRGLTRVDASATVPADALRIVRSLGLFSGLEPTVLERLAANLRPVDVSLGGVVFKQGDLGDFFYVIDEGSVRVVVNDAVIEELHAGDFFGEIALLRRVPRTATCIAASGTQLYALDGDQFIEAVTGQPEVRESAEQIVTERLEGL